MTKKVVALLALVALVVALPAATGAAPKPKRLGTDPAFDGPPALDVTYLDVTSDRANLEIRIGVNGIFPVVRGYPQLPGIQWAFDVKGRTFVAEAYVTATGQPRFVLFEVEGDSFTELDPPTGTYEWTDGFIRIRVPFKSIGATRGTVVSGMGKKGTEDVDAHIHILPTQSTYADKMATDKDYVIP